MKAKTGQTIYDDIMSLDADNNPISAATFDTVVTNNGVEYSGVTVNISLTDAFRGIFLAAWSADTTGDYQIYLKNSITNVVFISNVVNILPDSEFQQNIFIGL